MKKIPKLSDLIPITQGPQPPPYVRRQEKADVEIPIYKYTDDAASVWDHEDLKDGRMGIKLWQIQIIHEAHNPVTQGFYDTFNPLALLVVGVQLLFIFLAHPWAGFWLNILAWSILV